MKTTAPIIQQHELTSRCNNNCGFCYNPERCLAAFRPRDEEIERNLKIAEISVEKGVMAACPTGGEPLLVGQHLFDILAIYKNAGCYTSINTNARLVTQALAKKLFNCGLNSALASLHGIGKLHNEMVGDEGAFKETWQGLKILKDNGLAVMPNAVATAKNMHSLVDIGAALCEAGFSSMTVTPFLPSWGAQIHQQYLLNAGHYLEYFESIKKIRALGMKIDSTLPIPPCALIKIFPENWMEYVDVITPRVCTAGKSFGVISPDGNFRACIQAPYLEDFGGNMTKNYERSWGRANMWAEKKLIPQECKNCAALNICGGGCRTSCLWENAGKVSGRTMYMGDPLSESQAAIFIKRNLKDVPVKSDQLYEWRAGIRLRDEGWGLIVFNPANQSFTVLSDKDDVLTKKSTRPMLFSKQKTAAVLLSIGAIRPYKGTGLPLESTAGVLPAQMLLPRLGSKMNSKSDVYCLRADTGERYFF
jgi:radical SAM protein with 4Fe4S-binding SPASM domain